MKLVRSQSQSESDLYEIVSDGQKLEIVLRGEIVVPSLALADLETAQNVVAILNSYIEGEKAG